MPSSRLSCSARCGLGQLGVGLDAGALLADEQRDDLELRAAGGLTGPRSTRGLDLAHGAGEHRDDPVVVEVAHAAVVARRGAGVPGLALATSSQRPSSGAAPAGCPAPAGRGRNAVRLLAATGASRNGPPGRGPVAPEGVAPASADCWSCLAAVTGPCAGPGRRSAITGAGSGHRREAGPAVLRSQVQRRYLGGDRPPGRVDRFATPRSQRGAERRCDPAPAACRGSPQGQAQRRVCWLDEASVRPVPRGPRRVRAVACATWTTTGIIPVLARAVREVEAAVERGRVRAAVPHQVPGRRAAGARGTRPGQGRRDLHRGAARRAAQAPRRRRHDPRQDRRPRHLPAGAARRGRRRLRRRRELKREMLAAAGVEAEPEPETPSRAGRDGRSARRRAPGRAAVGRSPGSWPTRSSPPTSPAPPRAGATRRLAGWELLGPLLRVVRVRPQRRAGLHARCPSRRGAAARPAGRELMPHQAQLVAAAAERPPHLPARRRARPRARPRRRCSPRRPPTPSRCWSSSRTSSRPTGPARPTLDAAPPGDRHPRRRRRRSTASPTSSIVNYEVLDRHVGWLGDLGFRGMVVDEAHFIKNKSSQRSQHVLELSERIRAAHRAARC